MRLEAGQEIAGRYRLVARVGSGGMAEVWCADDAMLDRRVALKFLHDRFAQDAQFVERFRREASAAAGLQHANVVGVFDRGVHNGSHYIAMEYVEGASLKDLIARGLEIEEAIEIARQVLAGARFAHGRGIVHRDLKPQNVLIDGEGRARVADFGIARAGSSEITQTGSVLGTAQYLSPEQAQGLPVTAASDLYSVGVMLYESLTGRVPFEGDSAVTVALKQVSERPRPPSELNPAVSPALDAVVLRALAKDPANRYASASEFVAALDAAEADPSGGGLGDTAAYAAPPPTPPAEPPPQEPEGRGGFFTRRRVIALALLLLLLGGAALAYALTRPASVLVPTVLGKQEAQARQILEAAGFEVATTSVPRDQPAGTVLEQDPTPGSHADEGSTVTITVSLGPGRKRVPDVAGLPKQEARNRLAHRGFKVKVERQVSRMKAGLAIRTEPPAGRRLERGSRVTLIVSSGPKQVMVPSLIGEQRDIAEGQLRGLGLVPRVETRNADEPENQVIDQIPAVGTTVRKGSEVTIVVSTGAGSVVLRDVVGQTEDTARSILEGQGLKVRVVRQDTDQESEDGRVLDQSPSPGSRLHAGDQVEIFVGRFKEPKPPPTTTSGTTSTTP